MKKSIFCQYIKIYQNISNISKYIKYMVLYNNLIQIIHFVYIMVYNGI